MKKQILRTAAAGLFAAGCVTSGDVQNALGGMGQRAVNDAADSAYDSGKKAATEGPNRKDSKAEPGGSESNSSAKAEAPATNGSEKSDAAAQGRTPAPVGEVYANEYDFVPGDKVLFFEDFSDTAVGEYPVRWTRKGFGGGDGVEVIVEGGRHWLRIGKGAGGGSQDFIRSEFQDLPKKFTLEFDAYIEGNTSIDIATDSATFASFGAWGITAQSGTSAGYDQKAGLRHVAVSASDTYLKLYVDGVRVLVDADGVSRPIRRLGMKLHSESAGSPLMFTNFRLAEGGKDYRKELVTLGRIVTHGITFDSGSDALKPESGPTLRNILQLLQEDGALRFEVQGHTDNQGGDKVNQPLSERRAQAVKAWLTKQGVAASRLAARGLGAAKPIDTNGTSEGRANNRRVEFVKAK